MVRWITGGGRALPKYTLDYIILRSALPACAKAHHKRQVKQLQRVPAQFTSLAACQPVSTSAPAKTTVKMPPPPPYTPRWASVKLYFTILYFPFSSLPFPLPLPVICFRCHIELWVMTRIFIDCAWNSWNDRERLAGPVERYLDNMAFLCCGVVGIDPSCCLKCFVAWFCAFEVPFRTQSVHDSWVLWILFLLWVRKALLGLLLGHGPYWR